VIEFESKREQFQLEFKIEQLPDGTFVGRCEQPKFEIKGATPQEVQQKIEQSMASGIMKRLGIDMSASLSGPGIQVTLTQHEKSETPRVQLGGQMPLTGEAFDASSFRAQGLLKFLLIVGLLGAVAYWFFAR
jgi:hypothetical protein